MSDLADVIEQGWAEADRADPAPTLALFTRLARRHPGDPRALFAWASALDLSGRPAEAAPVYELAFTAGLAGDELRRGRLQYASTLRNLGRAEEAVCVLRETAAAFPDSPAVTAYLALAEISAGQGPAAVARLLTLALDLVDSEDLRRYEPALRAYAAEFADTPSGHEE